LQLARLIGRSAVAIISFDLLDLCPDLLFLLAMDLITKGSAMRSGWLHSVKQALWRKQRHLPNRQHR
jgi:hypothetical protein